MSMFPHPILPFLHVHREVVIFKKPAGGRTTEDTLKQDCADSTRPVKIDIEMAVAVMLASSEVENDSLRKRIRLLVIKILPSRSIDWEAVGWVKLWPFRTARL